MAENVDLALVPSDNVFDIAINPATGDFQLVQGFDTSIAVSLYGEQRALPEEVSDAARRRGWWGNTTNDDPTFQLGSKLWLLEQARLTAQTINSAQNYAQQAIQWLVDDGYLPALTVTASGAGGTLTINGNLVRDSSSGTGVFYSLWQNTGTGAVG